MTVLTKKTLDELLAYLEKSISKMFKGAMESSTFSSDVEDLQSFLSSQFDIRLENLLNAKHSSINHLESGMKNRVIQKKKEILDSLIGQVPR